MTEAATTTTTTAATGTTTAATGTTTEATTTTTAPAAFDWKAGGVDDLGLALVSERQWKGPKELIESYRNLEKLTGVPPEQIVKLPKDNDPAAWNAVYDRMGRPKVAADYKLPVPEGDKGEFAGTASQWFHEAGLSTAQAQKVATKWNEHFGKMVKDRTDAYTADVKKQDEALKVEWGTNHAANVSLAKQAAKTFGLDEATMSKLEQTMGFAGVHKFMFTIGSKLGEADFAGGGGGGGFGGMTPESARAEITRLQGDRSFAAMFNGSDPKAKMEAREKMDKLHRIAYPSG